MSGINLGTVWGSKSTWEAFNIRLRGVTISKTPWKVTISWDGCTRVQRPKAGNLIHRFCGGSVCNMVPRMDDWKNGMKKCVSAQSHIHPAQSHPPLLSSAQSYGNRPSAPFSWPQYYVQTKIWFPRPNFECHSSQYGNRQSDSFTWPRYYVQTKIWFPENKLWMSFCGSTQFSFDLWNLKLGKEE